ncbi:MAG: hypothetical protein R2939_01385 [Kofleriaceae bacterium]
MTPCIPQPRPARRGAGVALLVAALAGGCQSKEPIEARRLPQLQPTPGAELPEALAIPVTVDGQAVAPIDRARLAGVRPDFQDGDRRAWRMATLLDALGDRAATIAVTGEGDITLELHHDPTAKGSVPVLIVTRRGEVQAAVVDPADPFPAYHETGGRRARPGDPFPRLAGLARIEVRLAAPP